MGHLTMAREHARPARFMATEQPARPRTYRMTGFSLNRSADDRVTGFLSYRPAIHPLRFADVALLAGRAGPARPARACDRSVVAARQSVDLGQRQMRMLEVDFLRTPAMGDHVQRNLDELGVGLVNPRQTQSSWQRSPESSNPHFWAAFTLPGQWRWLRQGDRNGENESHFAPLPAGTTANRGRTWFVALTSSHSTRVSPERLSRKRLDQAPVLA